MPTNTTMQTSNECKNSLVEHEAHSTKSLVLGDESAGEEGRMIVTIEDINRMQAGIDAKQQKLDKMNEELALDRETLDAMRKLLERNEKEQLEIPNMTTTESKNFRSNHPLSPSDSIMSIGSTSSTGSRCPPGLQLKRQLNFKSDNKMNPLMKGASALNVNEFHKYDTEVVSDSTATPSHKMNKATKDNIDEVGDGDVWIEKIFINNKTGKKAIFFVSRNTGMKIKGEPPSGASRVIFLKDSLY
jgi:hypothetical protein